jgi:hypothetical protein
LDWPVILYSSLAELGKRTALMLVGVGPAGIGSAAVALGALDALIGACAATAAEAAGAEAAGAGRSGSVAANAGLCAVKLSSGLALIGSSAGAGSISATAGGWAWGGALTGTAARAFVGGLVIGLLASLIASLGAGFSGAGSAGRSSTMLRVLKLCALVAGVGTDALMRVGSVLSSSQCKLLTTSISRTKTRRGGRKALLLMGGKGLTRSRNGWPCKDLRRTCA